MLHNGCLATRACTAVVPSHDTPFPSSRANHPNRRLTAYKHDNSPFVSASKTNVFVAGLLGGALAVQLILPPCSIAALSPYEEAKQIVYGPTADSRIRACPSNVNPNCVSTASTNDSYSPVWRANESSAAAAADFLEQVVTATIKDCRLLRSMSLQSGSEYRAFGVQSLFGEDVVEFLIKPESVTDRNWEGDAPGQLVTYRSMAGSVKYIWPIQQPVSDLDTQRKRLKLIRDEIGWPIIGCELLECYQ